MRHPWFVFLVGVGCGDSAEDACDRILELAEENAIFLDEEQCEQDMSEELPSCVHPERYIECLDEVPTYRGARLCRERLCN